MLILGANVAFCHHAGRCMALHLATNRKNSEVYIFIHIYIYTDVDVKVRLRREKEHESQQIQKN